MHKDPAQDTGEPCDGPSLVLMEPMQNFYLLS
jgi:hypothetical protein